MTGTLTPPQVNVRILVALAVVLLVARLIGWAISKIGQPRVHGEVVAGIILGPSLLGVLWPEALDYLFPPEIVAALRVLAQLGVVLFMFLLGLELDLSRLRGHGHKAVVISQASIALPVALGVLLGLFLHPRLAPSTDKLGFVLFVGAAMAITAFPVLARVLQETGLSNTRIGILTITCAAVDDVSAWCILAVVVAIVESSGFGDAILTIGGAVAYVVIMLLAVRPLVSRHFEQHAEHLPVWFALAFAVSSAWITEQIGIHAIFGGFLAGAVLPRGRLGKEVHERLEAGVMNLLLPVFFVVVGLATRIDLLDSAYLWMITGLVILTAVVGKWGGSMFAARCVGESWRDAAAIGILMNTRGLTEIIILTVGLQLGVITTTIFTIMVIMALVTTLMATPLLSLISPYYHRGQTADPTRSEPVPDTESGHDAVAVAPDPDVPVPPTAVS